MQIRTNLVEDAANDNQNQRTLSIYEEVKNLLNKWVPKLRRVSSASNYAVYL